MPSISFVMKQITYANATTYPIDFEFKIVKLVK